MWVILMRHICVGGASWRERLSPGGSKEVWDGGSPSGRELGTGEEGISCTLELWREVLGGFLGGSGNRT